MRRSVTRLQIFDYDLPTSFVGQFADFAKWCVSTKFCRDYI